LREASDTETHRRPHPPAHRAVERPRDQAAVDPVDDPILDPIDDVLGPMVASAAVVTAGQLGLFAALAEPVGLGGLAQRLRASATGLKALLDVLATIDYVSTDRDDDGVRYRLGPKAEAWLTPESQVDFTPALLWGAELAGILAELADTVRIGEPELPVWERMARRPAIGALFSEYMQAKSRLTVDAIVERVSFPSGATRMLDLGGSHGLHTVAFCRRYPELSSMIFDLPAALSHTPALIEAAELRDRVAVRQGDYLTDPLDEPSGAGFDVVLCFELLHGHTPEDNQTLLGRILDVLRPGGRIVILEEIRGTEPDFHNAAFSLAMFAFTATRTYRLDEINDWLLAHGYVDPEHVELPQGSVSVVAATKPG
jgi:SAM-dependent methyltransferase